MIPALTFATYAISLNGRPVLPRARAAVVAGRVLLPVRALGNALGADVGYEAHTHRIVVQRGSRVASLAAGGTVLVVHGRAYAPLRTAAGAFGLEVTYRAASHAIALAERRANSEGDAPATAPYATSAAALPDSRYDARNIAVTTSPSDGARIHDPYPSISARFSGADAIDRRSLRVLLDGRDVTGDAALIGDRVLLTPRVALSPGSHDVGISAETVNGAPVSAVWQFVDTFAFSTAPAPPPYPIGAIFLDRSITPGTNAFDVIVQGAPGIVGYVGVDGVGTTFPLLVYADNAYVAHVVIPYGVFQPNARVAARLTLPNGTVATIVLPQRIPLVTVTPTPIPQQPAPTPLPKYTPTPQPVATTPAPRRSINVPTATPVPTRREPILRTSAPAAKPSASATPGATPSPTSSPSPTPAPKPHRRAPLLKPRPSPIPIASPPA